MASEHNSYSLISVDRAKEDESNHASSASVKEQQPSNVSSEVSHASETSHAAASKIESVDDAAKLLDDAVKREIQEQLGEGPDVPFARMRVVIIVALILFILAFGVYFAFVM